NLNAESELFLTDVEEAFDEHIYDDISDVDDKTGKLPDLNAQLLHTSWKFLVTCCKFFANYTLDHDSLRILNYITKLTAYRLETRWYELE
ncbi:unnamed protein product, partial [Amoebophrya sp. A120]